MIEKTYPSKRSALSLPWSKNHQVGYNPKDVARAALYGISTEEYMRRDKIIRQQAQECKWRVGQKLFPPNKKEEQLHGLCEVKQIYRTYHDFDITDAKKWPADDKPLFVTVQPERCETYSLICCTPNWLQEHSNFQEVKC